jgi:ElaB/YqjD/DUF883 family membrane-anchored ribosome-binding protein
MGEIMENQEVKSKGVNGSHVLADSKNRMCEATGKIREGVQGMVGETKNLASYGRTVAAESLSDGMHVVGEKSQEALSYAEKTIKLHPLPSLAAAAVAGFFLGGYLRRSRQ